MLVGKGKTLARGKGRGMGLKKISKFECTLRTPPCAQILVVKPIGRKVQLKQKGGRIAVWGKDRSLS